MAKRYWTEEEVTQLLDLAAQGYSDNQIAQALKRTRKQINRRRYYEQHKTEERAYARALADKDPEAYRLKRRHQNQANREQRLLTYKRSNAKRAATVREYQRQKRAQMTPEQKRERYERFYHKYHAMYREAGRRRRAREKGALVVDNVNKTEIVARDNSTCYLWCKRQLAPHEITLDHVVPLTRGGAHTADNLRVACRACNSRKNNRLLSELGLALT